MIEPADAAPDAVVPPGHDLVQDAGCAARRAADVAGVRLGQLRELAEIQLALDLFDGIWHPEPANVPITRELLRALGKADNYVGGAFAGPDLVGACVGFFGPPGAAAMHSHIAGVAAAAQGRQVGYALKVDQRAWALRHGVTRISWTFDPLQRRNAYFNLVKLGATAAEYAVNFYGAMRDAINGDVESDRLVVDWHLASGEVARACAGGPRAVGGVLTAARPRLRPRSPGQVADPAAELAALRRLGAVTGLSVGDRDAPVVGSTAGPLVLVGVPPEVQRLRRTDPATARAWSYALRDVLGGLLGDGCRVVGFLRAGWYVLARTDQPAAGLPAGGLPATGLPATAAPAAGLPAEGQPVTATGLPAAAVPAAGLPGGDLPAAGSAPCAGSPAAAQAGEQAG